MKNIILSTLALFFCISANSAFGLSLTLENQTDWEIHELYFSSVDEKKWGEDQLGDEVIEKGESFKLTKIAKDDYDVKIVDEDGDECIIDDVDFRTSEHFVMTNKILLGCQKATAEEAEESEE